MLKNSFTVALIGAKATALGILMSTSALAQTATVVEQAPAVVETPEGNTAVVPGVAATPGAPVGAVGESDYPLLDRVESDVEVAEQLIAQGFEDVHIVRKGAIMTITAQRAGQPTELVYSIANGSLVSVDGVELRPAAGSGGDNEATSQADDSGTDDGTDPGTDGGDADGDGDGTGDGTGDGSDDGSDGGTGDGSDGGTDGGTGDGSDGGSDGGEGGSDGGSDGGEGGSDGGEGGSDGGEGGTGG